jgi:PAS domain S-box-containing protein
LSAHECAEGSRQSPPDFPQLSPFQAAVADGSFAADALESLPSGFVVVSDDGVLLYANQTFGTMAGHESKSLVGRRFDELLSRGSAIFYETHFAPSLLLRGALEEISLELLRADGAKIPVFVNATVRPPKENGATQFQMSIFSAKQRRLYEGELLKARREFEEIAEIVRRSADGIVRLSAEGRIESWNNGARQIFGYSVEQSRGHSLHSLFPPEEARELDDALGELRQGLEVYRETVALHQGGRLIDVSLSLTPHIEPPRTLLGFSAIIRDTTARKKTEKALLQSEKLASVGRLASSIAHEINNPLESVTNLLYILALRVQDPETHQFIVTAQEELARVSQIATHTLQFHKQSSNRTKVNLKILVESVLALYRVRLENSSVHAISECKSSASLFCYEGELRQVMVNLIANAYDAMRSGGRLLVRAHGSRNWRTGSYGIRVLVADSGVGMEPQVRQHIFEPFYSTKGIGGTGLGLWITKDLVAKNNGSISLRSTARIGKSGTVFNLFFEAPE